MTDFHASSLEGPDSSVEVGLTFFFEQTVGLSWPLISIQYNYGRHRLKFFFFKLCECSTFYMRYAYSKNAHAPTLYMHYAYYFWINAHAPTYQKIKCTCSNKEEGNKLVWCNFRKEKEKELKRGLYLEIENEWNIISNTQT